MANSLYAKARQKFLEGKINWLTDDIRAILVDSGAYTVQIGTHEFLSDIPSAARIAGPVQLTGKTSTDGAADANDVTFSAVSGPSIEAVVLYRQGTGDADSALIFYADSGTGIPITPNSGNIIATWDNGVNRIFRL